MLTITNTQFDKGENKFLVRGKTLPFAVVEGINILSIVSKRLHWKDTVVLANANQHGHFSFFAEAEPGEMLRLRSFKKNKFSPWIFHRIPTEKSYIRSQELAHFRIGLTTIKKEKIWLFNLDPMRPIGEPNARLVLENLRTKKRTIVHLTETGTFFKRSYLEGQEGDLFTINIAGHPNPPVTIKVPFEPPPHANGNSLKAPPLCFWGMEWTHTPRFDLAFVNKPLYGNSIRPEDVKQGEICNCHLAAAASALAFSSPDHLRKMITKKSDHLYAVKFRVYNKEKKKYTPKTVSVTGDFYIRPNTELLYGNSQYNGDNNDTLWWPILEKAYAQLRGSYEKIGTGGFASELMEVTLGRKAVNYIIADHSADRIWEIITDKLHSRLPLAFTTYGDRFYKRYKHIHIFPDHCYSVMGVFENDSGRYLKLRNPWGEVTPGVIDARFKGVFELSFATFLKLFEAMNTVR